MPTPDEYFIKARFYYYCGMGRVSITTVVSNETKMSGHHPGEDLQGPAGCGSSTRVGAGGSVFVDPTPGSTTHF